MDSEVVELYLDDIIPNRFQPREVFHEEALKELSESIKKHGVIQPIIVRKIGDKYEIIAGERRYKATAMAGLTKIPAIIRNLDDKEASKVALLENLQRKDLSAIEEARTYQKILELDSMTQEELGQTMGKSQAAIANKMRLLSLPDEVQEALLKDQISERHARSLLNLENSVDQVNMLKKVIENRMTVRELDNEIKTIKGENVLPSGFSNDNVAAVINETGPKIEVANKMDALLKSNQTPKSNQEESLVEEYDLFDIPAPKEDLDILDDEEEQKTEDVEEIHIEKPESKEESINPHSDFKTIEDLLKTTQVYTLKDAINEIKGVTAKLQNKGFEIRVEEMDFENTYQVIIKIEKNK